MLEKIIYIAGYIEPNKKPFAKQEQARQLAYQDLDQAMVYILEQTVTYLEERGRRLHPLSNEALLYYKKL